MRLSDYVVREKMLPPGWVFREGDEAWNRMMLRQAALCQKNAREVIRDGIVIVVDNVVEYFYAGNDQEEWDLNVDFPSLAPPFDQFFIEWRRPSRIVSKENGTQSSQAIPEFTGLTCCVRSTADITDEVLGAYGSGDNLTAAEVRIRFRWWMDASWVCVNEKGGLSGPIAVFMFCIDPDGKLIGRHTLAVPGCPVEEPARQKIIEFASVPLHPLAMAISFMHCKNVARKQKEIPEKLSRAHERRHGKPLTRYHVLDIEPMKQVLRTEGQSEITGLKKALHICRGHFADYREGKGLFGKYHGRYWVPMHARGAIKEGVVAKDYAVKAPRR